MSYTLFLFLAVHNNNVIFALLLLTSVPHLYLQEKVDIMRRMDIKNYKMNELWQ